MDKNVIIFGVDMSSSVHIGNKEKETEVPYPIKFSRSNRKLC